MGVKLRMICKSYLGEICFTNECPAIYNSDLTCDKCWANKGCVDCAWSESLYCEKEVKE